MSDSDKRVTEDPPEPVIDSNDEDLKETVNVKTTMFVLSLANFCSALSLSLQGPLFPKLATQKELHPAIYSLTFGAHYLTILIFIPVIGLIFNHVKCKFILFTGAFIAGGCAILFGLLEWCPIGISFSALTISVRVLEGFGIASIKLSTYVIAASQFPLRIWKFYMWLESSFFLGFVLGPVGGGALYDAQGFGLPFYGSGVLTLLASVCVISILPEPNDIKVNFSWKFFTLFKHVCQLNYFYGIFVASFYAGFLQALLERFLRQFNLSAVLVGLIFSIPVILLKTTFPVWNWLSENRCSSVMLVFISNLLILLSAVLIGPASFFHMEASLSFVISALVLKGLGQGSQLASGFSASFDDAVAQGYSNDISTHCMIVEVFMLLMALGAFAGTLLTNAVLYESFTFQTGTLIFSALELLSMPFLLVYALRRKYRKVVRFSTPSERSRILSNTESS